MKKPPPADPSGSSLVALHAIAALASQDNPKPAQHVLNSIIRATGAHRGCILLLNPDSQRLEPEATHNLPDSSGHLTFEIGQGLAGRVALHRQPMLIPDIALEPGFRLLGDAAPCQMLAPLVQDDQLMGVVALDHDKAGGFTSADLELLVRLSQEAARVLRRLWVVAHLRAKARQLETMIDGGQAMVGKLEAHEIHEALARDIQHLFQSGTGALYLHDPANDCLSLAALSGLPNASALDKKHPTDDCLVGVSIRTRRQTEFTNLQSPEFHGLADLPANNDLRSALITPLMGEDEEVFGALVYYSAHIQRFDNDTKRLCAALANLGAVALQNIRLYRRAFQSEERLRKNEQLTTLGLLAAEIAHEIRNPLTVLKLLHGGLGLEFPEADPRRTDMRVISEKLDQLEAIVSRVLQFSQNPAAKPHTRLDLAELVADTLALLRLKLKQARIRIHFSPPPERLFIEGQKGQIQQVILNLLLNSIQAMPEGGALSLHIKSHRDGSMPRVCLDIADTGSGISLPLRDHIFESFLSGRPDGSGLGLAIVRRIVQSHQGDIELLSTGESGTAFRITLPRQQAEFESPPHNHS